jgi:hypothetical protein
VSVVRCHVEVTAMGRSLVQRKPAGCGVSESDPEAVDGLGVGAPWKRKVQRVLFAYEQ